MVILDEIFVLSLSVCIGLLFAWAFQTLPRENWQILACLPRQKNCDGTWTGVNLTYYGFFNAIAFVFAVAMFLMILGTIGIRTLAAVIIVLPVLSIGMWAARYIARRVENKLYAFSVGAASFTCIIVAPGMILFVNSTIGKLLNDQLPMIETLAAMAIAYAFGEGIGRLACISFGCCYGKPLYKCGPVTQNIFRRHHFIFHGKTKKISYASQLEGCRVVPVQAMTAVIYAVTGSLGLYLFLKGHAVPAIILTLIITQYWRFLSEFLRADYRGSGRLSIYQIMTIVAMAYLSVILMIIPASFDKTPNLMSGLQSLWHPSPILLLACLGIVSFVYSGKSDVTNSTINIQVVENKI